MKVKTFLSNTVDITETDPRSFHNVFLISWGGGKLKKEGASYCAYTIN